MRYNINAMKKKSQLFDISVHLIYIAQQKPL